MMTRILLLCFLIALFQRQAGAQECPKTFVCSMDSLGNSNDKIYFPLDFLFKEDSLIVYFKNRTDMEFGSFKVLEKKCEWNKDFSVGNSVYKLFVKSTDGIERYPTLKIVYSDSLNRHLELLYDNDEPRIFTPKRN